MILTGIGSANEEAFAPLLDGVSLSDFAYAAGAIKSGEAAGVALFNVLGDALMLDYIYISEKFRRQGIGYALINETLKSVGNGRQITLHVNFPERSEELREFFFSKGFRLFRDGVAYHASASSFLNSASFQKLIFAEPKNRVMRVGILTQKELQVLKNCMEAEDLDPATLDDDMLSGKLSLVTMDSTTARPSACILAEQKEDRVTILYLVNFSHDPKQLVDIFRAFKDAVVREGLTESELWYVAMNERTEALAGKLAEEKKHISFDCKVISALLLWEEEGAGDAAEWLRERIEPELAAREQTESAPETFLIRTLSKSQRTKRGLRFSEKARLEARMRNEMFALLNERRSVYPKEVLPQAKHQELLEFYNSSVSGGFCSYEDLVRDALLYRKYSEKPFEEEVVKALETDPEGEETKRLLAGSLAKMLTEQDVSLFDYESDKGFLGNEEKPVFAYRFTLLRLLSHVKRLLPAPEAEKLSKRTALIDELLADYEARALLIQSPFYVLLVGRDLEDLKDEELELRISQTEYEPAKDFMRQILEKRRKKGFGKGRSAQKRLEEL